MNLKNFELFFSKKIFFYILLKLLLPYTSSNIPFPANTVLWLMAPWNTKKKHRYTKKETQRNEFLQVSLGGDYLLSHFRSTIGVVRLNFSVRNGKRWDPHTIITLVSFYPVSLWTSAGDAAAGDALRPCDGNTDSARLTLPRRTRNRAA